MKHAEAIVVVAVFAFLSGCVAQQADLKQTEKVLQQRIKQQDDQFSQTRARQSQEISTLRDQELPQLRGELEKALYLTQDLQAKQEDLKHRLAQSEQQAKKLEQLAAKMDADNTTRHAWVQKSLDTQDAKVAARLDELSRAMEQAMVALKKDIADVVQRTNDTLAKRVDVRLEEQQKEFTNNQERIEQVSQKFVQFNQALTGFREALTSLDDRVGQGEHTASAYAADVNKSIASVAKTLESVGQKVTARLDEQDHRIESLAKTTGHASQKPGARPQGTKPAQRSAVEPGAGAAPAGQVSSAAAASSSVTIAAPQESSAPASAQGNEEPVDRARYERVLALFRDGDFEGARRGFAAFLSEYPNSDLAPNARYWQGESYYGRKDFGKAIDAYDRVELDYPRSEKAPAAILKKGYAYLALKDMKRASSAFKQVVTLYPKSPEAGKASDKLTQLKDVQ
ncbi:MAG: tol-pal system protein YbgF [Nitrospira sp.]|nr:tol-pal system protein YbgF [Nitrospira sp.]MDH4235894.1 tol-pal system protein YbgF [Nitrospira sp.]